MARTPSRGRLIAGLIAVLAMVATWEIMAKFMKSSTLNAERPYLCTYVIHSMYSVFLVVPLIERWWVQSRQNRNKKKMKRRQASVARSDFSPPVGGDVLTTIADAATSSPSSALLREGSSRTGSTSSTIRTAAPPAAALTAAAKKHFISTLSLRSLGTVFFLSILSTSCAYVWYMSLHRTLVSVNNVLYQSSAIFVYLLSVPLLGEKVSVVRVCSVLVSIGGLALVVYCFVDAERRTEGSGGSGGSGGSSTLQDDALGYVFLMASVLISALFEVIFQKMLGDHGS
eukprot:g5516.t1